MSEGLGIIAKFLYIIAVIVIAHGGWQVRSGNADIGKMSMKRVGVLSGQNPDDEEDDTIPSLSAPGAE